MLWYKLKDKAPIAYEKGGWDGLRSDKILVGTRGHKIEVVRMYEGIIDGHKYQNFYDENDCEVKDVILWAEIDDPF